MTEFLRRGAWHDVTSHTLGRLEIAEAEAQLQFGERASGCVERRPSLVADLVPDRTVIGDELDGEDSVADRRDDHRPDDWIVHPREATRRLVRRDVRYE